jgi:starvation-inducible DNA-binding protein
LLTTFVSQSGQIIRNLRKAVDKTADEFHDEGTSDFLTGLMEAHEEMAWMLRSFIEGESLDPSGERETALKTPAKA